MNNALFPLTIILALLAMANLGLLFSVLRRLRFGGERLGQVEGLFRKQALLFKEESRLGRDEVADIGRKDREELQTMMTQLSEANNKVLTDIATLQKHQLDSFSKQLTTLTGTNEKRLSQMRETLEQKIKSLQEDNAKKLDQMRETVDEKLQSTLEKRLGESFKVVSDRLEQVHKGLGEMQHLATGVGDLKRVLSNVKTRGTWGEIQLGSILEQLLTPEQYEKNVKTKPNTNERVEYAIKLPGSGEDKEKVVWLPIDAKFPQDTYEHLVNAHEVADVARIEAAAKQLENKVKLDAKEIMDKYVDPPNTTDFAIMFVPTEGLYAEIMRRPGLYDHLQSKNRILVAGPSNLAALLNSLQMGFRTLAIEKRSSEVWQILSTVKVEFGKFGDILEKTQKKLHEAGNTIDTATRKTRTIERKLRDVEAAPTLDATDAQLNLLS